MKPRIVEETPDLAKLYTFAVWMLDDRAAALARAAEVVRAAPTGGFAGWAAALVDTLASLRRQADRASVLSALDDLLRTDLTVTAGDHPQIRRDPRRLRVLQWELKRSCLYAVMRGVSVGARATFVLVRMLGHSIEEVGVMLGVTSNSVRIQLIRAERVLDNYLGARCQHMAPGNSCRCETRLGVALARGFVGWPADGDEMPRGPVFTGAHADVGSLYASLPGFELGGSARDVLIAAGRVGADAAASHAG